MFPGSMQFPGKGNKNAQQLDKFYVQPQKTGDSTQYGRDSVRNLYTAYDTHATDIRRRNIFRAGANRYQKERYAVEGLKKSIDKYESDQKRIQWYKENLPKMDPCSKGHDYTKTPLTENCYECTVLNMCSHVAQNHAETPIPDICNTCAAQKAFGGGLGK